MRYNMEDKDGLYERLTPLLEAFYMTGDDGFAVAAALKKHAKEFEEHQREVEGEDR